MTTQKKEGKVMFHLVIKRILQNDDLTTEWSCLFDKQRDGTDFIITKNKQYCCHGMPVVLLLTKDPLIVPFCSSVTNAYATSNMHTEKLEYFVAIKLRNFCPSIIL